ncbi:MAG: PKD domain-containing protein [Solirubrobacterales bacterium]|nr:PKD domain-containing protein [Solirubrobacterales bacterium]MCB0860848.1 PKD domain-containing protein [Solirubrobacterales bacterium]
MTLPAPTRHLTAFGLALAALLLMASSLASRSEAATYQEGTVEVNGYNWKVDPVSVDLNDIAPTDDGATAYTVLQILEKADNSQYDIDTVPGVTINLPGKLTGPGCTGDQVRAESNQCPTFTSTADATTMRYRKGSQVKTVKYTSYNPQIYIDRASDMKVELSPPSKKIKSGDSVKFTTEVTGAIGQVTYTWDFGDGSQKTTSKGSISHTFTGSNRTYTVVVDVSSTGNPRGDDDISTITVGKVKKTTKKTDKNQNQNDSGGGTGGTGGTSSGTTTYNPGYTDGYYPGYNGGYGGGTSATTPSAPAPQQQKQQKQDQQQSTDNGLQTVSGQLINPASTATVVPSTSDQSGTTQQANPADDSSGGGGMPGGVKAALGIGALLGLGGLAEAGAFAGGIGRLRFRP